MTNRDVEAGLTYHNDTKHSFLSVHNDPHFLDFANQPLPFKVYTDLEPIPLPRDLSASGVDALTAISGDGKFNGEIIPDLHALASLLHHSAGITKKRAFPGGEILFRAAACTGALYHIELYLVCGDLPGLDAGVYHFSVHDFALRGLRKGDHRSIVSQACAGHPAVANAPAVVISSSTFWRNSWKYRSRAYRHCFWDNGTILANLLAASTTQQIPATIITGFVDSAINRLLGLNIDEEVALSLAPLGQSSDRPQDAPPPTPDLKLETMPLSKTQIDYPPIREMHQASCLAGPDEVKGWLEATGVPRSPQLSGRSFPLDLSPNGDDEKDSLETVVQRRGSARRFSQEPISLKQLSTILLHSTKGVAADFLDPFGTSLNRIYLVVNDVRGLPSGSYFYDRERRCLEMLEDGDFRHSAGYLGLQQDIPADASVDVFFLADLDHILGIYGNRGYRAAQLEAGIMGGKMYLSTYAQHLGASGLTFFDDDVTAFFSPHAENMSVMFLVALGVTARRHRGAGGEAASA